MSPDETTQPTETTPADVPAPVEATPDPTQAAAPDPGPTPTTSPDVTAPTSGSDPAKPVVLDQLSKRSDADPLQGSFVKVVDGEHSGQIAAFVKAIEHDPETGYPATILVRFRDASHTHEFAVVDLGQVEQASQTGLVT